MILPYLSSVWSPAAADVFSHLWQSTVFAAVAALLTLLLRKNRANARYWLWLVSSLKFLFPFALLVSLGGVFAVRDFHAGKQAAAYVAMEQVGEPFVGPAAALIPAATPSVAPSGFGQLLPALLVSIWLAGFAIVLFTWCVRWRRMSKALRSAIPLVDGREVEALRRLESVAGVQRHIPVFLSRAPFEPGIFGLLRPVLILPEGIYNHLEDSHLQAVLGHEVWHVRRRDNLAAAIHMLVQALFWFHPLVWWLGGRLLEERERACDEQVLKLGNRPEVYAESILKVCEFCVESPLDCVSGVTGSDLKKRIVRIMTGGPQHKLSARKKLLMGMAGFLAVAVPVAFGLARGKAAEANRSQTETSSPAGSRLAASARFEVASIRQLNSSDMRNMRGGGILNPPNDGRFYATSVTAKTLVILAYDVLPSQIVGGPGWINSESFSVQAKADSSTEAELRKLNPLQAKPVKEHMLQQLLADRFELKLRQETKQLPVYVLEVAKNGPKLEQAKGAQPPPWAADVGAENLASSKISRAVSARANAGEERLDFPGLSLSFLAKVLTPLLGRVVVDKTELKGQYDIKLHWASMGPMMMRGPGPGEPGTMPGENGAPSTAAARSGPSIFTAIQEQLGLKLEPTKGPVHTLVIENIEQPSEN